MAERRNGVKASVFMAKRSELMNALREADAEISELIRYRRSNRAFERTKELFAERSRIAKELAKFGVPVEPHPAVTAHMKK